MKCIFCKEGEEKETGEHDCCEKCVKRGLKQGWLTEEDIEDGISFQDKKVW